MAVTRCGKGESIDGALRRFKRSCAREGIISEFRKREFYVSKSVKNKKKSEAARRKRKSTRYNND